EVVCVWRIQYLRRVLMVVVRPVGHAAQPRARAEPLWFGEQRHQRHEPAVAAAVDPDALGGNSELLLQIPSAVDFVLKIATAHVSIDRGSPVASIPRRLAIVDVEND